MPQEVIPGGQNIPGPCHNVRKPARTIRNVRDLPCQSKWTIVNFLVPTAGMNPVTLATPALKLLTAIAVTQNTLAI